MNRFERAAQPSWHNIAERGPLGFSQIVDQLNELHIEERPYISTLVEEYRMLVAKKGRSEDDSNTVYRLDELPHRVAGSLWEYMAFHAVRKQVPQDTHTILSPVETAHWCNRITDGQTVVRHPFFTYSLDNNFPVFDGIVLPKDSQQGPVYCLEYTAHATAKKMRAKLDRFKGFQRVVPSRTPFLSLTIFVPKRSKEKQSLDLHTPEPGMIEEIAIHPITLLQMVYQIQDMVQDPDKPPILRVP